MKPSSSGGSAAEIDPCFADNSFLLPGKPTPGKLIAPLLFLLPISMVTDFLLPRLFDILFLLLLFPFLFDRNRKNRYQCFGFEPLLACYLLVAAIAWGRGLVIGTLDDPFRGLPTAARLLEIILFIPVITVHTIAPRERRYFLAGITAAFVVHLLLFAVFVGPAAHLAESEPEWSRTAERISSTTALLLPIAAAFVLFSPTFLRLAALLLLPVLVALGGNRASTVAGLVALLVVVLFVPSSRLSAASRRFLGAVLITFLLLFLLSKHAQYGLTSLAGENFPIGEYGRFYSWHQALHEWRNTPFLGRGLGAVRRTFYEGDWVRVLHETGLTGLFFLLLPAVTLLRISLARRTPFSLSIGGVLLVLLLRSIFSSPLLRISDIGILLLMISVRRSVSVHPSETTTGNLPI